MTDIYNLVGRRVWVAGHRGMVGSAIVRRLQSEGCKVITVDRSALDLRRQDETETWIYENKLDLIFHAAAKIGGILANETFPTEFIYDNIIIEANIIHGAFKAQVEKLVFLGLSCIYPKLAPQPILEEALLTGSLESTNEWYAIAKIVGIKLCQAYQKQHGADFISVMPTNLYGPGDNYDLLTSHVLPALIRKAHEAKTTNSSELVIWGTGLPRREFLHVDDCADALVFLAKSYSNPAPVNVGSGVDITIRDLATLIAEIVGFTGRLSFDQTKPDGTPSKLMSNRTLSDMGWAPKTYFKEGIRDVYRIYCGTP